MAVSVVLDEAMDEVDLIIKDGESDGEKVVTVHNGTDSLVIKVDGEIVYEENWP